MAGWCRHCCACYNYCISRVAMGLVRALYTYTSLRQSNGALSVAALLAVFLSQRKCHKRQALLLAQHPEVA